jgi:hypothetical protein
MGQAACLPIDFFYNYVNLLEGDRSLPGQSLFILTALAWHLRTFGAIHGA